MTPITSSVVGDTGYDQAVSRFTAQTEELKKLLADEEEVVSTTSAEDSEDSDDSDSGSEEESGSEDSSDYDSEDSSDWDSDLEDLEAVLTGEVPAKQIQQKLQEKVHPVEGGGFKKNNSSPALMAMDFTLDNPEANILPGIINLKERMRRSTSGSYLQSPEYMSKAKPETINNPFAATRPEDHLKSILEGFSAASFPSETWHDYFLTMTDEHVEAHTTKVEMAVRSQDYAAMRALLRQGHTLQTCNKHGESIVHIACRRGTTELLEFLIKEADVSTRIRDDMGRTPLHDACWTHTPNFDIVMLLLQVTPELLFIVDHRGATPLTYVPREAWGVWCGFLQENRQFLRDMVKSLRFDRARYYVKTMVPCLKF